MRKAQYGGVVALFAADGVLDDWEEEELSRLREDLAIDQATHESLLAEHALRPGALGLDARRGGTVPGRFGTGHAGPAGDPADPMNADTVRALYAEHRAQGDYDRAWCCASILALWGAATPEEQRFFDARKRSDIPKVSARLDNESWLRHLLPASEDTHLGKVFEAIAYAAVKMKVEDLEARGQLPVLPAVARQDPATSTQLFARTFWWAAAVLGIRPPLLYSRPDMRGGLGAVAGNPPATVAAAGVLTGLSACERAFIAAHHLAMYRTDHYVKNLFPTAPELTVLLLAALQIALPEVAVPEESRARVRVLTGRLAKHLPAGHRELLLAAAQPFAGTGGASVNLERWVQSVETAAARAGLLLCGDIDVARRVLEARPRQAGDLTPDERMGELVTWVTSDSYAALRQTLGIAIEPGE